MGKKALFWASARLVKPFELMGIGGGRMEAVEVAVRAVETVWVT